MYASGILSFSLFNVFCSFTLIGCAGIALWIIRILFLAAMVSPVLYSLNIKAGKEIHFYSMLLGAYLFYSVLLMVPDPANRYIDKMYDVFVLYNIPYLLIYFYGIRFVRFSRRTLKIHCAIALICFAGFGIYFYLQTGTFIPTQFFKYPPRIYWISYAVFAALAVYLLVTSDKYRLERLKENAIVRFIGSSTLWIFLWHWLFLKIWQKRTGGEAHYLMTFLFVFSASLIAVYIQQKMLHFVSERYIPQKKWKLYLSRIFNG
jgi:peptidoglycan/LPS O-acetylase OafA/YrhL